MAQFPLVSAHRDDGAPVSQPAQGGAELDELAGALRLVLCVGRDVEISAYQDVTTGGVREDFESRDPNPGRWGAWPSSGYLDHRTDSIGVTPAAGVPVTVHDEPCRVTAEIIGSAARDLTNDND